MSAAAAASAGGADDVVISGWLRKEGHKVKNWKRRWFTLTRVNATSYTLSYSVDAPGSRRKGAVLLSGASVFEVDAADVRAVTHSYTDAGAEGKCTFTSLGIPSAASRRVASLAGKDGFTFALALPLAGSLLVCIADSDASRRAWTTAAAAAAGRRVTIGGERPPPSVLGGPSDDVSSACVCACAYEGKVTQRVATTLGKRWKPRFAVVAGATLSLFDKQLFGRDMDAAVLSTATLKPAQSVNLLAKDGAFVLSVNEGLAASAAALDVALDKDKSAEGSAGSDDGSVASASTAVSRANSMASIKRSNTGLSVGDESPASGGGSDSDDEDGDLAAALTGKRSGPLSSKAAVAAAIATVASGGDWNGQNNVIVVASGDGKTVAVLACASAQESIDWCFVLRAAIRGYVPPRVSPVPKDVATASSTVAEAPAPASAPPADAGAQPAAAVAHAPTTAVGEAVTESPAQTAPASASPVAASPAVMSVPPTTAAVAPTLSADDTAPPAQAVPAVKDVPAVSQAPIIVQTPAPSAESTPPPPDQPTEVVEPVPAKQGSRRSSFEVTEEARKLAAELEREKMHAQQREKELMYLRDVERQRALRAEEEREEAERLRREVQIELDRQKLLAAQALAMLEEERRRNPIMYPPARPALVGDVGATSDANEVASEPSPTVAAAITSTQPPHDTESGSRPAVSVAQPVKPVAQELPVPVWMVPMLTSDSSVDVPVREERSVAPIPPPRAAVPTPPPRNNAALAAAAVRAIEVAPTTAAPGAVAAGVVEDAPRRGASDESPHAATSAPDATETRLDEPTLLLSQVWGSWRSDTNGPERVLMRKRIFEYLLRRTPATSNPAQAEFLASEVVPSVEVALYEGAKGDRDVYLDATTLKARLKKVFADRSAANAQRPEEPSSSSNGSAVNGVADAAASAASEAAAPAADPEQHDRTARRSDGSSKRVVFAPDGSVVPSTTPRTSLGGATDARSPVSILKGGSSRAGSRNSSVVAATGADVDTAASVRSTEGHAASDNNGVASGSAAVPNSAPPAADLGASDLNTSVISDVGSSTGEQEAPASPASSSARRRAWMSMSAGSDAAKPEDGEHSRERAESVALTHSNTVYSSSSSTSSSVNASASYVTRAALAPRWGRSPHPYELSQPATAVVRHFPCQADGSLHLSLVLERRPGDSPHLPTLNKWQHRQCADCGISQTTGMFGVKAHYCWYTELLFCQNCMATEPKPIPWRIIHELDDSEFAVCKAAAEYIDTVWNAPLVAMSAVAPRTLARAPSLQTIMQLRARLADLVEAVTTASLETELPTAALRAAQDGDVLPSEALPPSESAAQQSDGAAGIYADCLLMAKRELGSKLEFMADSVELLPVSIIVVASSKAGAQRIIPRLRNAIRSVAVFAENSGFGDAARSVLSGAASSYSEEAGSTSSTPPRRYSGGARPQREQRTFDDDEDDDEDAPSASASSRGRHA